MRDRFVTEILPVVTKYANMRLYDPELRSLAVELAWHAWQQSTPDVQQMPGSVWARWAVRRVLSGRDLPRIRGHKLDVFDRLTNFGGAGMQHAMDKRPGPEESVMGKELLEKVLEQATDKQRKMILAVIADMNARTDQLAEELAVSSARISQMRREIMALVQAILDA